MNKGGEWGFVAVKGEGLVRTLYLVEMVRKVPTEGLFKKISAANGFLQFWKDYLAIENHSFNKKDKEKGGMREEEASSARTQNIDKGWIIRIKSS